METSSSCPTDCRYSDSLADGKAWVELCPWSTRCSFSRRSESRREGSSRTQRSSACQTHQHDTDWRQQSEAIKIALRRQTTADQGFSPRRDDRRLGCVRETSPTVSPTCCYVPCSRPLIYLSPANANTIMASGHGGGTGPCGLGCLGSLNLKRPWVTERI